MSQEKNETLEEAKKRRKETQLRQDNKLRCKNIIKEMNRYDGNTPTRAVWELLQNARDLSEGAEVCFILESDSLTFEHQGKPFTYDSLTSLIKQLSSQSKEDEETAGQFGTGFVTSHKFGRLVHISGIVEDGGKCYALENFKLDRSAFNNDEELMQAMSSQLDEVEKLLENEPIELTDSTDKTTRFVYTLDEEGRDAAKEGLEAARKMLPYVLLINERLRSVEIDNRIEGYCERFEKSSEEVLCDSETSLYRQTICCNDKKADYYYIRSESRKDIVILPLRNESEVRKLEDYVPRLFVYFPLIGTENLGLNFIFHSERFYPEEPRNAIKLPEKNSIKEKCYNANKEIFAELRELLYTYLEKNAEHLKNPHLLATVNVAQSVGTVDEVRDAFLKDLQEELVGRFANLPLVETENGLKCCPNAVDLRLLDSEFCKFLTNDAKKDAELIEVAKHYAYEVAEGNLPKEEVLLEWTNIVEAWGDSFEPNNLDVEDVVRQCAEKTGIVSEPRWKTFLNFLKACDCDYLLEEYPIIPNREGEPMAAKDLRDAAAIPQALYKVCLELIPDDVKCFVDTDYASLYSFKPYDRKDLGGAIERFLRKVQEDDELLKRHIKSLIRYCSFFPNESESTRSRSLPFICQLFACDYETSRLDPLESEDSNDEKGLFSKAFDCVVGYALKFIERQQKDNEDWWKQNRGLHLDLLTSLSDEERPKHYQTSVFKEYAIFPNQLGKLLKPCDLKVLSEREKVEEETLKTFFTIYQSVIAEDCKETLVHPDYEKLIKFEEVKTEKFAQCIDEKLEEDKYTNPSAIEIIDLILKEEGKDEDKWFWQRYFKNIDKEKASIFLGRLQDEEREQTFQFMKADAEAKEKISDLLKRGILDDVLRRGEEDVQREKQEMREFGVLHKMGKSIEDKLREQLQSDADLGTKIKVDDEQGGQDLVVYCNDKPVFYIEVKSRFNFNTPTYISQTQIERAVSHHDSYALCCVDLTGFNADTTEDIASEKILPCTYVHLDLADKLKPLIGSVVEGVRNYEDALIISGYKGSFGKKVFTSGKDFSSLIEAIKAKIEMAD